MLDITEITDHDRLESQYLSLGELLEIIHQEYSPVDDPRNARLPGSSSEG
jgi:hypothetical protein